jgi:hypothetical protein
MNRATTAYHEAGHAVADCFFGAPPLFASIRPAGAFAGAVRAEEPWFWDPRGDVDRLRALEWVVRCYAGFAAERIYDPATPTAPRQAGAADDFDRALDVLRQLGEERRVWRYVADATVLVLSEWAAVELVARRLLEVSEIDGGEVDLLVDLAHGNITVHQLATYRASVPRRGTGLPRGDDHDALTVR